MLYKSNLLTLVTMVDSWYMDEYWVVGPSGRLLMDCYIGLLRQVIYRLCIPGRAPVQRRLCPIFVRNVGSPDIHECFHGLTSSQRTPGIWGVTAWYQSLGIRIPSELGFG